MPPFYVVSERLTLSAETKVNTQVNFSYAATGIHSFSHSPLDVGENHVYQLIGQGSLYYNPSASLQCQLSGEDFLTARPGKANLHYFFAHASVKYCLTKPHLDLELAVSNAFDVRTYDAFYLSANTFTASSYALPGRVILMKVVFSL